MHVLGQTSIAEVVNAVQHVCIYNVNSLLIRQLIYFPLLRLQAHRMEFFPASTILAALVPEPYSLHTIEVLNSLHLKCSSRVDAALQEEVSLTDRFFPTMVYGNWNWFSSSFLSQLSVERENLKLYAIEA